MANNPIERNETVWNETYPWDEKGLGEVWSGGWGNSSAQWFTTIYPRIQRYLPSPVILEIAPGFGRWTRFLLPFCDQLIGVDLSQKCVDHCVAAFKDEPKARFYKNDGRSLDVVEDNSVDLCFSYDSLVHANAEAVGAYVSQLMSKLKDGGVAIIHHSNMKDNDSAERPNGNPPHWRAEDVSADLVKEMIEQAGGDLILQEVHSWGKTRDLIDTLTFFGKKPTYLPPMRRVENPDMMNEGASWRSGLARVYFADDNWGNEK
jgi:hypothetical protein